MLIQGARSALPTLKAGNTPVGAWSRGLIARAHLNVAVVALAAKTARTVWALPRHEDTYKAAAVAARNRIGGRETSVGPRCPRVATRGWPDCQPASWKPLPQRGTRCGPCDRDQDARLSISLASGSPEGRMHLCRRIKLDTDKPLADGAAHALSSAAMRTAGSAPSARATNSPIWRWSGRRVTIGACAGGGRVRVLQRSRHQGEVHHPDRRGFGFGSPPCVC